MQSLVKPPGDPLANLVKDTGRHLGALGQPRPTPHTPVERFSLHLRSEESSVTFKELEEKVGRVEKLLGMGSSERGTGRINQKIADNLAQLEDLASLDSEASLLKISKIQAEMRTLA